MSDLTEYFHKKYYPDMPIEAVHNAIYSNKNIFNAAVNHVQQKHYPDVNPAIIANKFGGTAPTTFTPPRVPIKTTDLNDEAGNRGMMKARMALDAHFGNPSAQRMVSPNPKIGMTPEGEGTHYMVSMDNYAVPLLQDKGGEQLEYNDNPPPSREDMRFEFPENAQYFADEHYKEIAPMMRNFRKPPMQ